jgi:putative transposase
VARLMKIGWSTWMYQKKVRRFDAVLRRRLCEMAASHVRYRYRRLTVLLRREGWTVNAKRIYRLYTEERLIVRTKQRRKIARRQRGGIAIATAPNQCWSMDFMSDKFADGRSFRILTVVDQFTRECVCLEADRAMTGMKVAQALEQAKAERGRLPGSITVDNGSEFSSRALEAWVMSKRWKGHSPNFHICVRGMRLISQNPTPLAEGNTSASNTLKTTQFRPSPVRDRSVPVPPLKPLFVLDPYKMLAKINHVPTLTCHIQELKIRLHDRPDHLALPHR